MLRLFAVPNTPLTDGVVLLPELSHSLLARTAQKIRHWLFGRMGGGLVVGGRGSFGVGIDHFA